MRKVKTMIKDPICGMMVDEASAVYVQRDGETYYFCNDSCLEKFLAVLGMDKEAATIVGLQD